MGFQIEDGQGSGKVVGVTEENRLKASCVTSTLEHEINHHDEQCYSVGVSISPTAGASTPVCILYVKNNSNTNMIISENMFTVDTTNVTVSLKFGDVGTPANTTAGSAVNRNAGSGNIPDCTIYVGADSSGITGLSGGNNVSVIKVIAGNESRYFEGVSGFIVPKNQVYTIWASGDCTGLKVGSGIHFHSTGH